MAGVFRPPQEATFHQHVLHTAKVQAFCSESSVALFTICEDHAFKKPVNDLCSSSKLINGVVI